MGDINLLDRINRLTKKVAGAVFPSDKATKNKFGIVKVGDNINVASGVISVPDATENTKGVVSLGSVGGFKIDKLWSGTTTTTATSILSSLTHPLSEYKAILVCEGTSSIVAGLVSPLVTVGDGVTYEFKNLTKEVYVIVTSDDVKIRNAGTGALNPVVLYGIK